MQKIKYRCTCCGEPLYPRDSAWIDNEYNVYCNKCKDIMDFTSCEVCHYYSDKMDTCIIAQEGNCIGPNFSRVWICD